MQIMAMVTMLIDHIGILLGAGHDDFRIAGRFALPLYCYFLTLGYKHTSNRKNYILRLAGIALISQIPYMIALKMTDINIVGTFVICLLVLISLDQVKSKLQTAAIVIVAIILLEAGNFDYGAYALLLILAFRYLKSHGLVVTHFIINIVFLFYHGWLLQLYSIFPTIILAYVPSLFKWLERIKIKRWVWRVYYPTHLLVLALVQIKLPFHI